MVGAAAGLLLSAGSTVAAGYQRSQVKVRATHSVTIPAWKHREVPHFEPHQPKTASRA